MKHKNHKKVLTIAVLVALLLTFTVSGTIAFLTDRTEEVQNVFTPSELETQIVEAFNEAQTEKTSIKVKNLDNSIAAYVRVAVVGNWCNAQGEIVKPWVPEFAIGSDWAKNDNYYYYTKVLPVGETTTELLGAGETISKTSSEEGFEGLHLEVTVMQQGIQSEPASVVTEMWGVQPESLRKEASV